MEPCQNCYDFNMDLMVVVYVWCPHKKYWYMYLYNCINHLYHHIWKQQTSDVLRSSSLFIFMDEIFFLS
uniref:Uncharacterized protein n=1 Tax=Manihot esculenta TaxID=3983 RepID=A0A2C9UL34_MANES